MHDDIRGFVNYEATRPIRDLTDTAALLTSARVTMNYREEYGHVGHVFSTRHLQEFEYPILRWLQQEVK